MTTSTPVSEHYAEAAAVAASRERGEPQWLTDRRAEGARAFAATPLPTPVLRPWKYTDVTGLDFAAFTPAGFDLRIEGAPAAGVAAPLVAGPDGDAAADRWGQLAPATDNKFAAANAALGQTVLVRLPRAAALEAPVIIEVSRSDAGAAAIFPRLLIVAEERAEATVVLRLRSGDGPLLVAGVVEVFAAQAARVRLLIDERWGAATQDVSLVRSRLDRDADVQVATLAIGGQLVKQTIEAIVQGEGANSTIRGVALGDSDQHFDFVTLQDHVGPRSTSDVQIKAALAGASRSIYYGVTRVEETAAGASANQENRNLLLSGNAKADSDPVLEILTADVIRCGHGATVGPVDAEALFYLQSRGLDYRTALQLLVAGFFQTVVADVPLPGISEELGEIVTAKLGAATL